MLYYEQTVEKYKKTFLNLNCNNYIRNWNLWHGLADLFYITSTQIAILFIWRISFALLYVSLHLKLWITSRLSVCQPFIEREWLLKDSINSAKPSGMNISVIFWGIQPFKWVLMIQINSHFAWPSLARSRAA